MFLITQILRCFILLVIFSTVAQSILENIKRNNIKKKKKKKIYNAHIVKH